MKIRLTTPDVRLRSLFQVASVIKSGNLTQGALAGKMESEFSERLFSNAPSRVVSSATTGLNIALRAAGIGPGDEVIVPAFTFPASANAVLQLGAIPVLADVEIQSMNVTVQTLRDKISSKTKAIMPVHAFGLAADMPEIMELAAQYSLLVVEDAACAIGSVLYGKAVGSFGDFGVFSFHPRKIITCGEGGLVVVNNASLLNRFDILRSHGAVKQDVGFVFEDWGYNYRLSDISAALLLDQLKRLDSILHKRRRVARLYDEFLSAYSEIQLPSKSESHTYQSYVIVLPERIDRDKVVRSLRERSIETTLGTYNLASQPYMNTLGYVGESMPNANHLQNHSLSLPISSHMTKRQVKIVGENLLQVAGLD